MPLPLTVTCFSKIQIGFTFLVPAHLGSPRKRAVKWMCACVSLVWWKGRLEYLGTRIQPCVTCSCVCFYAVWSSEAAWYCSSRNLRTAGSYKRAVQISGAIDSRVLVWNFEELQSGNPVDGWLTVESVVFWTTMLICPCACVAAYMRVVADSVLYHGRSLHWPV